MTFGEVPVLIGTYGALGTKHIIGMVIKAHLMMFSKVPVTIRTYEAIGIKHKIQMVGKAHINDVHKLPVDGTNQQAGQVESTDVRRSRRAIGGPSDKVP